ncbi:hypothetical protein [Kitasatospora phosalacinea]|uniref:Uncharacterized protein n=1 Tax=Kitasatospora phosalacinea TaxID=2065 RepID=A0ABW6GSZ0_9ACTN
MQGQADRQVVAVLAGRVEHHQADVAPPGGGAHRLGADRAGRDLRHRAVLPGHPQQAPQPGPAGEHVLDHRPADRPRPERGHRQRTEQPPTPNALPSGPLPPVPPRRCCRRRVNSRAPRARSRALRADLHLRSVPPPARPDGRPDV